MSGGRAALQSSSGKISSRIEGLRGAIPIPSSANSEEFDVDSIDQVPAAKLEKAVDNSHGSFAKIQDDELRSSPLLIGQSTTGRAENPVGSIFKRIHSLTVHEPLTPRTAVPDLDLESTQATPNNNKRNSDQPTPSAKRVKSSSAELQAEAKLLKRDADARNNSQDSMCGALYTQAGLKYLQSCEVMKEENNSQYLKMYGITAGFFESGAQVCLKYKQEQLAALCYRCSAFCHNKEFSHQYRKEGRNVPNETLTKLGLPALQAAIAALSKADKSAPEKKTIFTMQASELIEEAEVLLATSMNHPS